MQGNVALTKAPRAKTMKVAPNSIARISRKSLRKGFCWITMLYQVVTAKKITASVSEEPRAKSMLEVTKYGVAKITAVTK